MTGKIIGLVDDHQVVRDGIKLLLADPSDLVVCAEAGSARDAGAVAAQALPDVVVMDVRLQDGSGIQATRDLRAARPQTAVLMLTSFADDEALFASIMAGAAGHVLKQIRGDELVRAIGVVGRARACWIRRSPPGCWTACARGSSCSATSSWPGCRPRRSGSWAWSPRAGPTARSGPCWAWPRRRSRTTSPAFSRSWRSPALASPGMLLLAEAPMPLAHRRYRQRSPGEAGGSGDA